MAKRKININKGHDNKHHDGYTKQNSTYSCTESLKAIYLVIKYAKTNPGI